MKRFAFAVPVTALSLIGLLAGGCPFGSDDDPPTSVTLEEMPAAISGVICSIVDQCYGPGFLGGDCETNYRMQFEDTQLPQLQDAVARGTMNYDADKMAECIDAMAGAGCEAINQDQPPAACEAAMAGTVPAEGTCFIDEECAGDAFCNDWDACPGFCESYLAPGADCSMGGDCGGGTTCFDGICAARPGVGQPCGGGTHPYCSGNLDCEGEMEISPGVCTAQPTPSLAGLDASCDPEGRILCQSGLSCVVTALQGGEIPVWQCKAAVGSGAACFFGVPDQCPDAQYCAGQPNPSNLQGTCTTLPGENQACAEAMMGEGCQSGLYCREGVCFRGKRLTEGCSQDWDCVSDYCDPDSSTCAVPEC